MASGMIWRLFVAIGIGVAVQAAFLVSRSLELVGQIDASEATTDFLMRSGYSYALPPSSDIVIVDFNDNAYRLAGWPRLVPRKAIATILQAAVRDRARLVVIDVDVSWPSEIDGQVRLNDALVAADKATLPVLLVREPTRASAAKDAPFVAPRSSFDPVVASSSNIRFASAMFPKEPDNIVRRAIPAVSICTSRGAEALVGAHVYAAAVAAVGPTGIKIVDEQSSNARADCVPATAAARAVSISSNGYQHHWTLNRTATRIMFAPPPRGGARFEKFPGSGALAEVADMQPGLLTGKIVVVGSSSIISRDRHETPVGNLFGAEIVASTIAQSLAGRAVTEAHALWTLVVAAIASAITWVVWLALRLIFPRLNSELRSELVKLAAATLWVGAAALALGFSSVLAFALPQYAVFLFLVSSEGAS